MSADLLLANATILDPDGLRFGTDVSVRDGFIADVAQAGTIDRAGTAVTDCVGKLLVPSFTNVHHHFYSGLLRGAPPPTNASTNQRERLERIVWPFERRLSHDDVRIAVRVSLLEAIAAGTTTIVDHHVSSGCIPSVLDVIAEEVHASGLRAVLCYEITDRDGTGVASAGLDESDRFLRMLGQKRERVQGMVGMHAMSTVGPDTLAAAVALGHRHGVGVHLHLGESPHDNDDSVARFRGRPVERLQAAGALGPRTLVAHAVHVTGAEVATLAEHDVLVAYNPRSNASNGVGVADLVRLREAGLTIGVGGDGFTQDVRGEFDLLPLLQRQFRCDPCVMTPRDVIDIGITGNATVAHRVGGWQTGRVAVGYHADLVAFDYDPLVPIDAQNALWHLSHGLPGATVRHIWVGGVPVLRDGQCTTLDSESIRQEAMIRIKRIWATQSRS